MPGAGALDDFFTAPQRPPLDSFFNPSADPRPPLDVFFDDVSAGSSSMDLDAQARKRRQLAEARAHGDLGAVPTVDTSLGAVAKEGAASFLTGVGRQITDIPEIPGRLLAGAVEPFVKGAVYGRPMTPGAGPGFAEMAAQRNQQVADTSVGFDLPGYSPFAADVRAADAAQQQRFTEAASALPTPVAAGLDWAKRTATNTLDPLNWLGAEGAVEAAGGRRAVQAGAEQTSKTAARGAIRLSPEVGQQTSRAAQETALGLRATPAEGAELARLSLPIGEGVEPPIHPAIQPPSILDSQNAGQLDIHNSRQPEFQNAVRPPPAEIFAPSREAVTERGTRIGFDYQVRDASELATSHDEALRPNPAYPAELQPRDRTRLASEAQVGRIERNLNPELLGESPHASNGAPIVGPDGIVESGNARSIALKRAYRMGGERAGNYRTWLSENAPRFGIDPAAVDAVPHPVLVRVRNTAVDRAGFAVEANEAPQAAMSATERAGVDAGNITPEMLDSLRIGEGGVNLGTNPDFVRSFASKVNPAELGSMFDAQGQLSSEGTKRLQNAILSKAYGDPEAIAQLAESADSNVRTVGNALMQQAPRYARMGQAMGQGALHPLDITPDIGPALKKLSALRAEGTKVPDYLAQGGLFGSELSPESRTLLALFDANARSGQKVSGILGRYADLVEGLGHPRQAGLFGAREIPTRMDLLREAATTAGNDQGALFAAVEPPPLAAGVEAELAGRTIPPAVERPRVADGMFAGQEEPLPASREIPRNSSPSGLDSAPSRPPGPPPEPGVLPGMEPPDMLTTGTKNAVTEAERAARGLPEVEALGRKSGGDNWLAAKAAFEADPQAARTLAARVAESPRPLNGMENDLLLHDRMKLTLDHREALDAEAKALAAGDTEGAAMAKIQRTSLESAMQVNDAAAKRSGTAWHESGMARQKLIAEDYSPLHLTNRAQVAAAEGGRALPEAIRRQLVETSQQLEAAQTKLAGYEERVSQIEAQRAVGAVQRDVARAGRSGARRGSAAALDAEYSDLSKRFAAISGTPRAGLDPDLAALVARMARNRVQRGAKGLAEVVDGIYQDVRPHVEGLEPRDVRDAISGYGVTRTHPARSDAVLELARVKQEARTLSALEDARAAGRPAAELDVLQRKVDQISTGNALPGRGPASDAERLAATKARLARREKELTQQLAEGYFPKNARRPPALDPDAIALQGQVEGLKNKADSIIRREELKNRSFPEKVMDYTAGWGRFNKLIGTPTLQKITAAAGERALLFKPIEEFIGAGASKLPGVKQFAAQAPIEGGGSLKAIAKSYAGFFGKTARQELAAGLKGQEGAFSQAMHPGSVYERGNPAWMDYPGRVHAGLKAPAKIAAYEYAMEKQAQHYLRLGQPEALTDVGKIAEMKARAWEHAQRDIFMGDNAAVRKFRAAFRDEPGQSLGAKATNTAANVLMPIVKVPTNYALEVTHYLAGLPKAGVKMGNVVAKGLKATAGQDERTLADVVKAGLDTLAARKGGASAADQADQILMNIRKGSLGAGMIALGATGVVKVGGYYHPGEHRGPDELKPGEVQLGGKNTGIVLPHTLLHHPAVEALQVGGTIHNAKTLGTGLEDSAWGLAEQVPFFEEPITAGRDLRKEPSKFLGQFERGMTLPPDAQRLARVLDQKEARTPAQKLDQFGGFGGLKISPDLWQGGWAGMPEGVNVPEIEAVKRRPRGTFVEKMKKEEEAGIPGMRPYSGGPP